MMIQLVGQSKKAATIGTVADRTTIAMRVVHGVAHTAAFRMSLTKYTPVLRRIHKK